MRVLNVVRGSKFNATSFKYVFLVFTEEDENAWEIVFKQIINVSLQLCLSPDFTWIYVLNILK